MPWMYINLALVYWSTLDVINILGIKISHSLIMLHFANCLNYNFQRIYRYIFNPCTNIYGENYDYTYCKGDLTNIMIWIIGRIITHFDKGRCPLLWYWELNKQSCLQCDNMQGQTTCLDWLINKSYWCIGICFCMCTLN